MQLLNVNEIFYSLQGEGARAGEASIFIRLSGCNLKCSFCDTEFNDYVQLDLDNIAKIISRYPNKRIIWTGGEPTLQLNDLIVGYFNNLGYKQSIESNGSNPIPKGLDYVTISPKGKLHKDIDGANEIRILIEKVGQKLPNILSFGDRFWIENLYLSPVSFGDNINRDILDYCIHLCKEDPKWKLSVQQHKMWKIA